MLRGIPAATALRTVVSIVVLPVALMLYSAGAWLTASLGGSRERVNAFYRSFARTCLRVAGTRLEVRGLDELEPGQAYVVVPNHESNWDSVGLVAALNGNVRFVAKRQIIRIPVFGHALLATGNVMVDRANTREDVERIRRGMQERPVDVSVLFYAEGTRSRDGALHAFKKGAFATAIGYGLPVLPVGVAGSRWIWQPLSFWIRQNPMVVQVGRPIPVEGLELADRDELRDRTHEAVRGLRARARQAVRELGGETGGID